MLPIILGRYLVVPSRSWQLLYGVAFLLSFASLVTTFSRGGWLAAVVGLLLLAFVNRGRVLIRRLGYLISVLICVLLILVAFNYVRSSSQPEKNISILERISSLPKVKEGSIGSRLLIWQSALRMIAARPLVGWGPDAFHLAFSSFSSLDFVRLEGASKRADNAHNYFLQLAATQGIFGLFAFVALLISFFWTGFSFLSSQKRGKNHCRDNPRGRPNSRTGTSPVPTRNPNVRGRKRTHRHTSETPSHSPTCLLPLTTYYLYAGLLASIAGYVAYLLSGINSVEMGVMFWTFLGALSVDGAKERVILRKSLSPPFLALTILLITTAAGLYLSLMPLVADVRYASAEKLESDGFLDLAIQQAELALAANPYQDRYWRYLGSLYAKAGDQTNALASYLKAKQINRFEIDNSGRLAELYLQKVLQGEERYYKLAEKEFSHILKISPYSAIARSGLGFVYLATGRFERAAQELNKAVELDPQDAKAQLFLGMAYEKLEKKDKASRAYTQALSLDPNNKDALAALGRLGK